jgi:hypothetical protein
METVSKDTAMRVHRFRLIGALWIVVRLRYGYMGSYLRRKLTQFAIKDTLESYFFPQKPDFPEGGKTFECPNCDDKGAYQRTDLSYRPR